MTLPTDELTARLDRAIEARDYLDASLTRHETITGKGPVEGETRVPDAHKALRLAYDATPLDTPFPENAFVELADLIWQALEEITAARRAALAAGPSEKDPASEYERLLAKAEEAAAASGGHDRARALAEIAGRWIAPELLNARKRSPKPEGVTHFGSPTPLVPAAAARIAGFPESDPSLKSLRDLQALDLDPERRASYVTAAVELAKAEAPLAALVILAGSAARGHFTETDMLELRTLINRPARPARSVPQGETE